MKNKILFSVLVALLSGCSHLFYHPDGVMYYPPEMLGYTRQDIYFLSADGYRLHAWLLKNTSRHTALGTVVLFHGNAQNLSSHYVSLAWMTQKGYDLFVYDYQGYGESLGSPDAGKYVQDARLALDEALKVTGDRPLIVYAQSLGGAIAMRALAENKAQPRVALLVLDSTFSSYQTVAKQLLKRAWLTWPMSPLGGILISDEFAPAPFLESFTIPALIIHDERDPVVDFINGEEIYRRYGGPKTFWKLDEGGHVGVFFSRKKDYRTEWLKFVEKALKGDSRVSEK